MFATLRFSFRFLSININSTITTVSNNHNNTQPSTPITTVNIWNIQQCWSYLFITLFVEPKLDHHFHTNIINNTITNCNKKSINPLLNDTYITLKSLKSTNKFSFHDLISLRRSIMILAQQSQPNINIIHNPLYVRILKLISKVETKFITNKRYQYPIFNIHLPRSAGTTMCYQFQVAQYFQKQNTTSTITRPIYINPVELTNCNIGDGFPFYQYLINSHAPKTCLKQYIQAENFTMFARESPLYNNKHKTIFHPLLCNKFVYVLSVRSPVERILSWLENDATFLFETFHNGSTIIEIKLELKQILTNFFQSLFDYDLNPAKQNPFYEVINIKRKDLTAGGYKIKVQNEWIRGYSNNALTRWIGYEFTERDLMNNELIKGMLAHSNIINNDDIHFKNAVELLLRVDYVLNFASYGNDDSTRNVIKYGTKYNESESNFKTFWIENILSNHTRIQDPNNNKSVWNMFAAHMDQHFDTKVFDWNRDWIANLAPKQNELFDLLSQDDWKTLYRQNYFDFRLYSLSKLIGQIDVQFDQMFSA